MSVNKMFNRHTVKGKRKATRQLRREKILEYIKDHEGVYISLERFGELIDTSSPSSISLLISNMMQEGLISREVTPGYKKKYRYYNIDTRTMRSTEPNDGLIPYSVKGTSFYTPMDIAPGKYVNSTGDGSNYKLDSDKAREMQRKSVAARNAKKSSAAPIISHQEDPQISHRDLQLAIEEGAKRFAWENYSDSLRDFIQWFRS